MMNSSLQYLEIRETKNKGRGVFALKDFQPGDIIEECPVIVIPPRECDLLEKTILDNYYFEWESELDGAIVLGYGSIYNHSFDANATFDRDFKNRLMVFTAVKPIKIGEEILTNYNGDPADHTPIDWIETKD